MKVRKTAFGSIDAVPHRHFEDPAEAVLALKAAGAFVCALETTEGASSLFDVKFPLPPPVPRSPHAYSNTVANAGNDQAGGLGSEEEAVAGGPILKAVAEEARAVEGQQAGFGRRSGGVFVEDGEAVGGFTGDGGCLGEGRVVALVLGNEVTGVDERVLGLCDLVVEVRRRVILSVGFTTVILRRDL